MLTLLSFIFFCFVFFNFSTFIYFSHNFLSLGVWDRPQLWHVLPPAPATTQSRGMMVLLAQFINPSRKRTPTIIVELFCQIA